jgi:hypothetical protein
MTGITTLIAALLFVVGQATTAPAQVPPIRDLITVERKLNTMCRGWSPGGVGERRLDQICSTRDNLRKALNKLGYCYGKQHEAGYQMKWHRCTSTSLRHRN